MMNEDKIAAGNSAISKFMERSHVFNYHQSWNLLVPVIDRLTSSGLRASIYFNPNASSTVIYDPLNRQLEITSEGTREEAILSTWKSVVKFLETTVTPGESNA